MEKKLTEMSDLELKGLMFELQNNWNAVQAEVKRREVKPEVVVPEVV